MIPWGATNQTEGPTRQTSEKQHPGFHPRGREARNNAMSLVFDSEENSMTEEAKEWKFGSQKSRFCSIF